MKRVTITFTLAVCLLGSVAEAAPGDDLESSAELAIARLAEQFSYVPVGQRPILPPLAPPANSLPHEPVRGDNPPNGLFVGVDDSAIPTNFIDPETGVATAAFPAEVWGAAQVTVDAGNYLIFITDGSELLVSSNGQPPTACCSLASGGSAVSPTGAAFDPAGERLLFSRNISPESIYSLPYSATMCTASPTCELAEAILIDGAVADFGGLAWDPESGVLYATNDDANLRGLVSIGFGGSITAIAPYPDGQTDIDGLAYHDGKLYLVTDEPGSIYVYNLADSAYETPLPSPWTSIEIFAGATFVATGPSDIIFQDGFDPDIL